MLQWAEPDESTATHRGHLEDEIADVLIYLVRLADVLGIDPIAVANKKITANEARFPTMNEEAF